MILVKYINRSIDPKTGKTVGKFEYDNGVYWYRDINGFICGKDSEDNKYYL